MLNRKISPEIYDITNINFQKPTLHTLKNNVKVYTLESSNAPVIKLDVIFEGAGIENQSYPLQALFANSLLKEAPIGKLPNEIAEFFDYYGSYLESFVDSKNAGLRLFTPIAHFDKILPVFADLLKKPSLPEFEFNIMQKKYERRLSNNMKKNKYIAMSCLSELLFGEKHPLGYFAKPNDVQNLNYRNIVDFVENKYINGNFSVIASGYINEEILNTLNSCFSELKCTETAKHKHVVDICAANEKYKVYNMEGSLQSAIYAGIPLINISEDELLTLNILNLILGGYFGSRLMKNIREDKGFTYGIGSIINEYSQQKTLKIVTEVNIDTTQQTIDEIINEIRKLKSQHISSDELNLIKRYYTGEIISALDGVFATSVVVERLLAHNRGFDYIDKQINRINSITANDIIECANKYLNEDNLFFAIAGNL